MSGRNQRVVLYTYIIITMQRLFGYIYAAAELGRNPVSKHQSQPQYGDEQVDPGLPNPSRETKFSGTSADREIFIFPVQLITCRTGNLTRLIHTLAICVTIHTILLVEEGKIVTRIFKMGFVLPLFSSLGSYYHV